MAAKEVINMLINLALFILSAIGLAAAVKTFVQRGRTVGLWA